MKMKKEEYLSRDAEGKHPQPEKKVWGTTATKIEYIMRRIFDKEWTGKSHLKITVDDVGIPPTTGLRYIKVFRSPRFGMITEDNLEEMIKEWRRKVEPYLIHANWVHYRVSTRGGSSRLYLLYDRKYENEWLSKKAEEEADE